MKTRVLFGICGAAVVLLALFVFPPVTAQILMTLLAVCAAQEFTAAVLSIYKKRSRALQLAAMALAVCMSLASARGSYDSYWMRAVVLLGVAVMFGLLLRFHGRIGFNEAAGAFFGGVALPYLLMSLIRILTMTDGRLYILMPLLAAWGSDTFALFAGMAFGRHKLAPVVSPKKTVEGSIGGIAGAVVLLVLYGCAADALTEADFSLGLCVSMGLIGSILGQLGDLSFSVVKRESGIKDYGDIFPGHGGVLDRFDSVIFVAPAVELLLHLFTEMGLS